MSESTPNVPDLDHTIYFYFACPACTHIQYQPLDKMNFCVDIDVEVADDGRAASAWLECTCLLCGQDLKRNLDGTRYSDDDANSESGGNN